MLMDVLYHGVDIWLFRSLIYGFNHSSSKFNKNVKCAVFYVILKIRLIDFKFFFIRKKQEFSLDFLPFSLFFSFLLDTTSSHRYGRVSFLIFPLFLFIFPFLLSAYSSLLPYFINARFSRYEYGSYLTNTNAQNAEVCSHDFRNQPFVSRIFHLSTMSTMIVYDRLSIQSHHISFLKTHFFHDVSIASIASYSAMIKITISFFSP